MNRTELQKKLDMLSESGVCTKRSNRGTEEYSFVETKKNRQQNDLLSLGRDYLYQTVIVNGEKICETAISCTNIGDVKIKSWSMWENGEKKEAWSLRIHVAESGTRISIPVGDISEHLVDTFNEAEKRQRIIIDIAAKTMQDNARYALRIRMPGDVIATKSKIAEGCGGNRIFILGAVDAISCLSPDDLDKCDIIIRTESDHLFRGFTYWIDSWMKDGTMDSTKKNVDLWEQLHIAKNNHHIRMEKIGRIVEDEDYKECRALLSESTSPLAAAPPATGAKHFHD